MLRALCHSSHARISEIAVKALKEVSYHLEKSADMVVRLGDGTEESHRRMQDALNGLWTYTGELFIDDEVDDYVDANKIAPKASSLKDKGLAIVEPILREAKFTILDNNYVHKGGKRGIHSEYLGHMLVQMQYLQRAYPNSTW